MEGEKVSLSGGGELESWWSGGHENVNLDVSEAIYSSLGIQSWEGWGVCVYEWTQFQPYYPTNIVL